MSGPLGSARRWLIAACLIGVLPQAAIAGDVIVDNKTYEETARMVLRDGELVVHLRPKLVASAPQAAPASDAAGLAAHAPALNQELAQAIANDMQSQASPGLSALGVTAGAMSTPGTPREFGAALAKGVDASGKVREGVAMQFSPASLFMPMSLKGGRRYADSAGMQAWARTSVELATAKSEDTRIGQQVAMSVSSGLIDDGDPRLYWSLLSRCTADTLPAVGRPGEVQDPELVKAEIDKARRCYAASWAATARELWKAPRWYAGYAKAWYTGDSGKLAAAQAGPSMLWTTYSQGFDALNPSGARFKTLVEVSASRRQHALVQDPADPARLASEARTDATLRLRWSRDQWSAFADTGLARVRSADLAADNLTHFGYGVEYKVSDTLWLVLGSVTERGYAGGAKRTLLSTGLRFGQSDKDLVGAPPQGK